MTETPRKKSFPQRNAGLIARLASENDDFGRGKHGRELVDDRDPAYPSYQKNVPPKMKLTATQPRVYDRLMAEQRERQAKDPEWQRRRKIDDRNASRERKIRQGKK